MHIYYKTYFVYYSEQQALPPNRKPEMTSLIEWLEWLLWKNWAKRVPEALTAECVICGERIYPDQAVGITWEGSLVHVGFHSSLKRPDDFCDAGGAIIGTWNGVKVIPFGEEPPRR